MIVLQRRGVALTAMRPENPKKNVELKGKVQMLSQTKRIFVVNGRFQRDKDKIKRIYVDLVYIL